MHDNSTGDAAPEPSTMAMFFYNKQRRRDAAREHEHRRAQLRNRFHVVQIINGNITRIWAKAL